MNDHIRNALAGKRILIIEDDLFISRLYKKWLSLAGGEVRTANNGALGLEELKREPADIILLDLGMPGLDGFDTLTILRSHEPTERIPVIILSNTTVDEKHVSFNEIRAHGVTDILRKYEVSLKEIVSCVAKYFPETGTKAPVTYQHI